MYFYLFDLYDYLISSVKDLANTFNTSPIFPVPLSHFICSLSLSLCKREKSIFWIHLVSPIPQIFMELICSLSRQMQIVFLFFLILSFSALDYQFLPSFSDISSFWPDDPTIVSNYRLILILTVMSNMLEKTLTNQVTEYLEISNSQWVSSALTELHQLYYFTE